MNNSGIVFQNNERMRVGAINNHQVQPIPESPSDSEQELPTHSDVAVLTVLAEETYAIISLLKSGGDYRKRELPNGMRVHEAVFTRADGKIIRVAARQTSDRGQESAALAFADLHQRLRPRVIALVGVAGGVQQNVQVGDVVVADSVILYDQRREDADGVWHRGATRPLPVAVSRAVQDFLSSRQVPSLTVAGAAGQEEETFRVHYGPIGSGNAVITDVRSHLREFLVRFNEKVMAVETEAVGVAQAFHEIAAERGATIGWLTVRGISDRADRDKGHADHAMASYHAAATLSALLDFL